MPSYLPTSMSKCASCRSRSLETEEAEDALTDSGLALTSPDLIAFAALNCMTQSMNLDVKRMSLKGAGGQCTRHKSH